MKIEKRISSFSLLGKILMNYCSPDKASGTDESWKAMIDKAVSMSEASNAWFTRDNVMRAIREHAGLLTENLLTAWLEPWKDALAVKRDTKTVGIVMAGNIPMVGFHDLLCVLISGNRAMVKLSSNDQHLVPLITGILERIEPEWKDYIEYSEDRMSGFDAIIATGSTNTSRYFEYYFGKYPNIIRKNRKSAAILTGNETAPQLDGLADDIFLYFGMGCRNISKLYLPEGYDLDRLTPHLNWYAHYLHHHKYRNNYDYHKSIFLVNRTPFFDGPFFMMTADTSLSSPVSVIHYEHYRDIELLRIELSKNAGSIQCLVGNIPGFNGLLPLGSSQQPGLTDYADNIDTLEFVMQKI